MTRKQSDLFIFLFPEEYRGLGLKENEKVPCKRKEQKKLDEFE